MVSTFEDHLNQIDAVMNEAPGHYYIKDIDSRLLYANQSLLDFINCGQKKDLIGTSAYDFTNKANADRLTAHDQKVLETNTEQRFIEYVTNHRNEAIFVTSHKKPIYYKKELIGVVGFALTIPFEQIINPAKFCTKTAFVDITKMTPIHLSPRRREVLFYALKGMTSKDIAAHLGLSKRTVENNLATIKERNAYSTTADMIRCIRAL